MTDDRGDPGAMGSGEGREIWFLNREILVVKAREPFVDWVMSVSKDVPADPEWVRSWVTSFLLPQFEDEEEALDGISEYSKVIFELLLSDWILTEDMWPEDLSWEAFQRMFSFERIEIAWDLVDGPLSSDPPEPSWEGPLLDA